MRRLIPVDSVLSPDQMPMLQAAIDRRIKQMKKLKYGQVDESLWLMEELEHLILLQKNNTKKVLTDKDNSL